MTRPRVSVVVVNYDGEAYLPRMRDALRATDWPFHEILVCDDVSRDGSRLWLRHHWPEARMLPGATNSGCARMRNLGLHAATGELVLLLDNDGLPERGSVDALVAALASHPEHVAAMPRVVLQTDPPLVQCDGAFTHPTGQMGLVNAHRPLAGVSDTPQPITSLMGTAMLLRRQAAQRIGGFSEDMFIYYEDHDFGTRLVLLEGPVLSVPTARINHLGGTKNLSFRSGQRYPERRSFLIARNRQRFLLRTFETRTLLALAPLLLVHEAAQAGWSLAAGRIALWCDATLANLMRLGRTLNERQWIQERRRVTDKIIIQRAPVPLHPGLMARPWQRHLLLRFDRVLDGMASALLRFVR